MNSSTLEAGLTALSKDSQHDPEAARARVLAAVKPAYQLECDDIRAEFAGSGNSRKALTQATALVDRVISALYRHASENLFPEEKKSVGRLAVVAVGGYGRGELFPFSDVDILFLHDGKSFARTSQISEFILYILWDMGLQVGQAVRTLDETLELSRRDVTVRTNVLDARFICGNQQLAQDFQTRYWSEVAVPVTILEFVAKKLGESDERHERAGHSRFLLEPNIKEGTGGLRDLHTLYWLARYAYRIRHTKELVTLGVLSAAEHQAYQKAQAFLTTVRVHLHLLAGRADERLTFDMQRAIAERMGYSDRNGVLGVERFMQDYFRTAKTTGSLVGIFCAVLEDERKAKRRLPFSNLLYPAKRLRGFVVDSGRLIAHDAAFFKEDPVRLIEAFAIAQEQDLEVHPRTLQLITRQISLIGKETRTSVKANELFVKILTSPKKPHDTLRQMNETGVLGRFIPDFGRVVGQMQYDMYHVYTVDEHTIFAIEILNQIEAGKLTDELPLASRIIHRVASRRVLYLAVFCHDIAKGRGGDHSMLGEKVARSLSKRFGFDAEETETAAWLVREHLLFSRTAFKRDLTEEKTIFDFVEKVQSPERLRLLLVLTAVDIRAVGPTVWNSWKGQLLRELFYRAETRMGTIEEGPGKLEPGVLEAFAQILSDLPVEERGAYLALGSEQFFCGLKPETHRKIAVLLKEAQGAEGLPFALKIESDPKLSITEVLLLASDRKRLFSTICGILTSVGANIVGAKVFTLKNGIAVEQFHIQNFRGEPFDRADKLAQLQRNLQNILKKENIALEEELRIPTPRKSSRDELFRVPPRVIIENTVSTHHTVIEVNGRDRAGFLYTITKALADLELGISTAHISSYGERAVDVFYVKDKFGMKLSGEAHIKQVREKLVAVLKADQPDTKNDSLPIKVTA